MNLNKPTGKYKKIHKSWAEKSRGYAAEKFHIEDEYPEDDYPDWSDVNLGYLDGAKDFRKQTLAALEYFTVMTVDEPVIYNDKVYVSKEDVISLIEGLYAETKQTKIKI